MFFSRMLPVVRTFISLPAGVARMPFWRFQLFSALGGLAWSVVVGVAGYLLGSNLGLIMAVIRDVGIGGLAIVAALVVIAVLARVRAARL